MGIHTGILYPSMGLFICRGTFNNYGVNEMSMLSVSLYWALESGTEVQLELKDKGILSDVKILKIRWDDLEDIVTYKAGGEIPSTISLKQIEKITIYK